MYSYKVYKHQILSLLFFKLKKYNITFRTINEVYDRLITNKI